MRITKYFAAAAAASLAVAPVMAAPVNPAASLSLGKSVRASSTAKHTNDLLGGGGGIFALLIVAGVAAGVIVSVTKDDNSSSN